MTTKPKGRKFRTRHGADAAQSAGEEAEADAPAPDAAGGATDIDAIRAEGLTGRQLRMARRMAQKHNLPATSDFDAVRLLRKAGIDPFKRSNTLELVVPKGGAEHHEGGAPDAFESTGAAPKKRGRGKIQLPQTVPDGQQTLPSTELSPIEQRSRQIMEIQRDIARRRRRKLLLLLSRLMFFVMLPTLISGYYYYRVATPMYSSESEFMILQADNMGGGGIGSLLSGTQLATNQDSISVQSFLQSKSAMLRLDDELGFASHFTQDWIDPLQRLEADATNEDAYKIYRKYVKIGYDPTEGVIRMAVSAADPLLSSQYSKRLITYAEEMVNNLTQQKRGDQMKDALSSFETAETERRAAQEALVNLQQEGALLDPEAVIGGIRSQINGVEAQLQEKNLKLAALLDNRRPNAAKVEGARADLRRLEEQLAQLNARMLDASKGENSLARLRVRIQMAQADLATRDLMLQSAMQQLEQTRMEANRQVRYLTTSVEPVPSEAPSYPRKFENTLVAFLLFAGIYLLVSITISILREQVTS